MTIASTAQKLLKLSELLPISVSMNTYEDRAMRIIGGQVQTQSQHEFQHAEQRINIRQSLPNQSLVATPSATQSLTTAPKFQTTPTPTNPVAADTDDAIDSTGDLATSLLKGLVEAMSGRHIDLLRMSEAAASQKSSSSAPPQSTPVDNGRFLQVEATHIDETEITEVAFSGEFNTADGTLISIDLQYSLQRRYSATTLSASVSNPNLKDPLILNFDGLGVALNPGGTQFDIDSDGVIDALPTLRSGSAYLALDRNGDGIINNGSELFGAQSGDGFGELAQFDVDSNSFIDEADPIFIQLQLFRPNETTRALSDVDVGAIFLGNIASPARLTDSNNQSLGQLRATGFYLTNTGTAGLVQKVDLVT